jgi:hypothetical protein
MPFSLNLVVCEVNKAAKDEKKRSNGYKIIVLPIALMADPRGENDRLVMGSPPSRILERKKGREVSLANDHPHK